MAQQKIQLRKIRDFGEVFSDAFQFIRQEFRPLLTSFVLIGGPFILINSIFIAVFQNQSLSFFQQIIRGAFNLQGNLSEILTPGYFIAVIFTIMNVSALKTVVSVYMDFYDKHNHSANTREIWRGFLKNLLKIFLFTLLRYCVIVLASIITVIPVLGALIWIVFCAYFIVITTPYFLVLVSEQTDLVNSFTRCMDISKNYFWTSFAVYLIAFLILMVSSAIVSFFVDVLVGVGSYFTIRQLSTTTTITISIINTIQYFFYLIFFVCVGLHYYNLVEVREGTGIERRLENLGKSVNSNAEIEEQY